MTFFSDAHAAYDRPAFFAGFSASVIAFFHRLANARNRTVTIQTLEQLSDRELSDIGISRNDIVRQVYRDIY